MSFNLKVGLGGAVLALFCAFVGVTIGTAFAEAGTKLHFDEDKAIAGLMARAGIDDDKIIATLEAPRLSASPSQVWVSGDYKIIADLDVAEARLSEDSKFLMIPAIVVCDFNKKKGPTP